MSTKATAARIYEYGEPDVFRFETMDVPDPVGHEVLVRNTVIGLNFVDIYYRRGTLPVPEFPAIIGDEASGVVEAVGPNVTLVKVGDRVAYADAFGAYTTVRLYPEDRLTLIPDGVTDDQAASSLLKGLTARYLLKETVQLHEGDTVLYHAAAGGVGQIFTQWARSLGIHVIGTVSTAEKAQIALQAGCTAVVNYSTEDFVERTFELTGGQGVKAVYDSVGKDTFRGSLAVLRPRGTLVQFGNASGFPEPIDPFELAPSSAVSDVGNFAALQQHPQKLSLPPQPISSTPYSRESSRSTQRTSIALINWSTHISNSNSDAPSAQQYCTSRHRAITGENHESSIARRNRTPSHHE